jgi:heterodisulfide reductase subunit C
MQSGTLIPDRAWASAIERASGEPISLCYACGVCTGSCPLAPMMDLLPSRLIKAVQLGLRDRVTGAVSPWLCVACETCAVRCPNGIDVARVMDAVRQEAVAARAGPRPDVDAFHQWFLWTVRLFGRAHEGLLSAAYSLQQGRLRHDLPTGLALMRRRRLALWPHMVRRRREIVRVFRLTVERPRTGGEAGD